MSEVKTKIEYLDKGTCEVCGRKALVVRKLGAKDLKDGSVICGDCARKIRFMYPVMYKMNKQNKLEAKDPIKELNLDEAKEAIGNAMQKLEDMRESNGFDNAVFRVDEVNIKKGGLFSKPIATITGYVIYGRFDKAEYCKIIHDGVEQETRIAELGDDYRFSTPVTTIYPGEAGYPCLITIVQKGLNIKPGDLIVKD